MTQQGLPHCRQVLLTVVGEVDDFGRTARITGRAVDWAFPKRLFPLGYMRWLHGDYVESQFWTNSPGIREKCAVLFVTISQPFSKHVAAIKVSASPMS